MTSAEVGILVLDEDLRIRHCNSSPEAQIDLSERDDGCSIGEVGDRFGLDALERDVRWVLDEGAVVEREIQNDGRRYRVRVAPPNHSINGTDDGVKVTFTEMPEQETPEPGQSIELVRNGMDRKRREGRRGRQARPVETALDGVVGRIPVAVYLLDNDGRFTYVNDRAEALLDHSAEDLLGTSIWERFPEAAGTPAYEDVQRAMETGEQQESEFYSAPFGGWVEQTVSPAEAGLSVCVRDVTRRKKAEEKLRESKERLQVALDAAGMGTWRWDLDARTVTGDATFMEMFDLPPTDEPVPVEEFLKKQSEEDALAVERVMETNFEPGESIQDEELEERIEERTQQVRELASKLTLAEQRERHHLGEALHEGLQQHLYGLQLRLDALPRYVESGESESLLEQIDTVKAGIEEAITTTRQLSVDLSPPVLEGEGLVDALGWLKTHMEDLHDLEVDLQAPREEVPIHTEPLRVLLFQVVRELLLNVVEHAGVDRATVDLRVEQEMLIIVVADEGAGFAPGTLEGAEGMGIGLTSIRERMAFFEGEMTVDAAPNQGTRITVRIPVRAGWEAAA